MVIIFLNIFWTHFGSIFCIETFLKKTQGFISQVFKPVSLTFKYQTIGILPCFRPFKYPTYPVFGYTLYIKPVFKYCTFDYNIITLLTGHCSNGNQRLLSLCTFTWIFVWMIEVVARSPSPKWALRYTSSSCSTVRTGGLEQLCTLKETEV